MPAAGALYDYVRAADAMVCIGSMIAFEAIALGIMPIVFENPATYPATSLAEYESGLFVTRDAAGLIEAIEDVRIDSRRSRVKRLAWPAVLKDVFGDLDTPLEDQMDEAVNGLRVTWTSAGAGSSPLGEHG
jgi:hypothetical protein